MYVIVDTSVMGGIDQPAAAPAEPNPGRYPADIARLCVLNRSEPEALSRSLVFGDAVEGHAEGIAEDKALWVARPLRPRVVGWSALSRLGPRSRFPQSLARTRQAAAP